MKWFNKYYYLFIGICILWFFFSDVLNFFEAVVIIQLLVLNEKVEGYVRSLKTENTYHIKIK